MAKKKKQVTIEWSITNERQLDFLRACGLSYYFDGPTANRKPLARMVLFGGSAGGGKVMPF